MVATYASKTSGNLCIQAAAENAERHTALQHTPHNHTAVETIRPCTDLSPLAARHLLQTPAALLVVEGLLRQQPQRRPEGQQSSSSNPLRQQHIVQTMFSPERFWRKESPSK